MKYEFIITDITDEEIPDLVKLLTKTSMNASQPVAETVVPPTQPTQPTQPVAETVVPPTQPVAETVVDLNTKDADGLVWDARIHSSSKKMTKKGVWAARRGRTEEEYQRVKAEQLGTTVVPPTQPVAETVVPPTQPVAETVVPPTQPVNTDINSILLRIQQGFASGKMNAESIPNIIANINSKFNAQCVQITDIASNQEMMDYTAQLLTESGI